ncbi:replication initiator protein A [Aestuariibius insulae]|uniref:replication initiator protein A n=1 Tax=Aestuariibius insulae TaxID=2058287 RepID=UPI00345ED195
MSTPSDSLSERAGLTPFVARPQDGPPRRDQRDLMERPFFSLSKSRRVRPIHYRSGAIELEVHAVPEHGMASIWDADILIWAGSQLVEAADAGLPTSRFVRFTPYQFLTAVGRGTGKQQYDLLKRALARLQSTSVRTTIRNGPHWQRHQFSWINEWEECVLATGRSEGLELVLPDWFYRGVLDRSLVLTIDPDYFRLRGGIERWLYRVARKHGGRQPRGWAFQFRHLHAKSGSLARYSDFALDLRRIVQRQPLPGYALRIERDDRGEELLRFWPASPVDRLAAGLRDIGRSGANPLGRTGASVSADQAHESQPGLWDRAQSPAGNESNRESNFRSFGEHLRRALSDHGRLPGRKGGRS